MSVLRRELLYSDVLKSSALSRLAKRLPLALTGPAYHGLGLAKASKQRHLEILADTILIMREGGFDELTAQDIYEYCINCGSRNLLSQAERALEADSSPVNEEMKKQMVPVLEAHARKMLDVDWRRLAPEHAWRLEQVSRLFDTKAPESWVWGQTRSQSPNSMQRRS